MKPEPNLVSQKSLQNCETERINESRCEILASRNFSMTRFNFKRKNQ